MVNNNETSTLGWTASPDGRGTLSIITSCLLTILLCCWTSVCPNLPAISDGRWPTFRDKLDLACIALLGPEFLLGIAVGQRASARRSKFSTAGFTDWTLTYAFFADMGGFVLEATDLLIPIPMNAEQLFYLIEKNHLDYPTIAREDIEDKSKSDKLARFLTLCQVLWFAANFITRPIQGLALTTLELTTISFIIVMLGTSYFWMYKPSDVSRPVILHCKSSMAQIRSEAGLSDPDDFKSTPLDFIGHGPFIMNLLWEYFLNILRTMHIRFFPRPISCRPHNRIRGDHFLRTEIDLEILAAIIILPFCSTFMCAWNFHFPTPTERILWRCASVYTLVFGMVGGLYTFLWHNIFFDKHRTNEYAQNGESIVQMIEKRGIWHYIKVFANKEVSSRADPDLRMPISLLFPITVLCAIYCVFRAYILIEDAIGLRQLPESAYGTVDWSKYLPHL